MNLPPLPMTVSQGTKPPTLPPFVLLTHEFKPFHGGVATYCAELARSIAHTGQSLEIWAPDFGKTDLSIPEFPPVIRLPGPGNLRPRGLFCLAREVWKRRHELQGKLLILPSVGAQMAVFLLSVLPGWPPVPTALLWHGSEALRFRRSFFWRILADRFFRKTAFFFAASPYAGKLAEDHFPFLRDKMTVIPCAPGSDAFREPESLPPDPLGRIRILTLARLHPRKGQLHTIMALASLPPSVKGGVLYQLAGEGDPAYLGELRLACERAGIALEYLGPVTASRLSSVYAQCDIYAMTSQSLPRSVEGFGITYLEAGLQAKPVIACRTGGVEGAVLDGKTGLVVGENDLAALTEAFRLLISDSSLRRRLGEGNLIHSRNFSWDHSAQKLLRCISADKSVHWAN